ncbi:putative PepSY-like beta-lactamase-inhibitor [Chitinophaga skermanii]|uniref:Putative PepSY-like beta-lactamase-inhibitor n=1 Tax=Chitinophaga skermanii TaxID=331697 RepID=A0A327QKW8_9BACT|nr:PepSY-like domain-containing protein [Chitinophaga skermanii]RAJ03983.1 putative PepSY-like beta-lactamase-inhibitor [Chitinophaga skermanii]
MKKLSFIICVAIFTSVSAFSQQKKSSKKAKVVAKAKVEAPANVKDAFQQNFTGTSDVIWVKTSSGNWIGTFKQEDVKTAAEYDAEGKWIATRSEYTAENLPGTISATIKNKFPSSVVNNGVKIERADVAAYYKVNIDDNGTTKALLINENGTITQ